MIGNRKIVALCAARIQDTLNYDFVKTLGKRLGMDNISVLMYTITADNYWNESQISMECNVYDLIDYDLVDIIVIMDEQIKSKTVSKNIIENAKKHDKPVIIIDGDYDGCYSVGFDFERGFEKIVRHVIEDHKITDVMFMGGIPGNPFSDSREKIFKKIIKENKIPFKKEMITYGYFWAGATQDAVQRIIGSGHIPQAIICANDIMAINVEVVLQKYDLDLASKIVVTGFDGVDEIYFSTPQITSIRCNHVNLANSTFEIIQNLLNKKKVPRKTKIVPDTILAGSCGCHKEYISPPDYFTKLSNRFFNFPEETRSIFRVIEKMQATDNLYDASNSLDRSLIYALSVMLNKSYINSPNLHKPQNNRQTFDKEMILFFDSDSPKPFQPYEFDRKNIIPNLETLLENPYPIIITELDYSGTTFGYAVFHFGNYNILNYARIPIILTAIRTSLGGFVSLQYQKHLVEQLDNSYKLDSLTGIYNRQGFNRKFTALRNRLKKNGGPLTVILSDLDRLKFINDAYGHSAGDNAIKQAALSLKQSCPPSTLCVRFGGDEMLAVIEGDVDSDEIKRKIESYQNSYNEKSKLPYKVRSSIGIFKTNGKEDIDFETLIKQADKSLYEEKQRHHAEE